MRAGLELEGKCMTEDHSVVGSRNGRRQRVRGQEHQYMDALVVRQCMVALVVRHIRAHDPLLLQQRGQSHQRHQLEAGSFPDEQLALEQAVRQDCTPWAQSCLAVLQIALSPTDLYSATLRVDSVRVPFAHDQLVVVSGMAGFVNSAFFRSRMQDQRWLRAQGFAQLGSCYPRVGFLFVEHP
jgi:hypothetical protein